MSRIISILGFLFLLTHSGWAQCAEQFISIDSEDGLSQNTVYSILQDKTGYLWIGTQDGLNRYDGREFTNYRRSDDPKTLSNNFTTDLAEAADGNIWITTLDGTNELNPISGEVTRYFNDEKKFSNATSVSAENERVVIPFASHLAIGKRDSENLTIVSPEADFAPMVVELHDEKSYMADHHQGVVFTEENEFIPAFSFPDSIAINNLESTGDGLWVLHQEGAYIWKNGELNSVLEGFWCTSAFQYSENVYWIGTWDGLLKINYDDQTGLWSTPSEILTDVPVNDIIEDREGNVWIGSIGHGLLLYPRSARRFKILGNEWAEGLLVWSILDTDDHLFLGTSFGLDILKKTEPNLDWTLLDKLSDGIVSRQTILPGKQITHVIKEGNILWISTSKDLGLYKYDLTTGKSININLDLCSDRLFHMEKLEDSTLAISTIAGLALYDRNKANAACFKPSTVLSDELQFGNYIIHCSQGEGNDLWLSTTSGLLRWNRHSNSIRAYQHSDSDLNSISYQMVSHASYEGDQKIWLSTLDRGLSRLDIATDSVTRFGVDQGLKNGMCYSAIPDEFGRVWTSHNQGISCLDPELGTFNNYGVEDGINFLEFSQNAFFQKNGFIWFGGTDGIVCFRPEDVRNDMDERPTVVNSLHLNFESFPLDGDQLEGNLRKPEGLTLLPGDRALTIGLSALDFSQKPLKFQYMLEGYDPIWIEKPDYDAVAHFTSLPYGEYIFKARHSLGNGTWSPVSLEFPISVVPPIWMTWWFITLSIILLLLLTIWVVRNLSQRRLKARLRDIEIQQKVQKERERISMDLHDNVGSEITHVITSLDTLAFKIDQNKVENPGEKIEDLSDFARGTMTQLRDTIWAINKDQISVKEFTSRVNDFASRMLGSKEEIKYHVRNHGDTAVELNPTHTINLYRIVQESINNIVKHADADLIAVEIHSSYDQIKVLVIDDGVGIDFAKDTTGHYGLINMENRMKEIGGRCKIESKAGAGTKVTLTLSLK